MKDTGALFRYEKLLVDDFCALLEAHATPWGRVVHTREFEYGRGRTDVIGVDDSGKVIAFEMKLRDWGKAMHQAYRNTCFAHRSYVVLPERAAELANQKAAEFIRRTVGICCVRDHAIVEKLAAKRNDPIQPWLTKCAVTCIGKDNVGRD